MSEKDKAYLKRIKQALEFIEYNLEEKLSLDQVAEIACYSPFHFHRIFKVIVGETLQEYVTRKRIEKIAIELMHRGEVNMTSLAHQFGFNSSGAFSRSFAKFYGVSATEFRKNYSSINSKISHEESKNGEKRPLFEQYVCNIQKQLNLLKMEANIKVEVLPNYRLASVTHIGVNGIERAFEKVLRWSSANSLFTPDSKLCRVFHDSFKVTAPDKVRMSVALKTDKPFEEEDGIFEERIVGGRTIVCQMEIRPEQFEESWGATFLWMSDQGYRKASDRNAFEVYHNDYREHPEGKFLVDLCIPIQ